MAINTKTPASINAPNQKTEKAQNNIDIPNQKTEKAAQSLSIPNQKTEKASASLSIPNQKTEKAAASLSAPNQKTEIAPQALSTPNQKTEVLPAAIGRVLKPAIDLDFENGAYSQLSSPKVFSEVFNYSRASSATFINRRLKPDGRYEYFLDTNYVGSVENLITWSENIIDDDWSTSDAEVSESSERYQGSKLYKIQNLNALFPFARNTISSSGTVTLSAIVKKGNNPSCFLRIGGTGIGGGADTNTDWEFNLESGKAFHANGADGSVVSRGIEYKGGGFYRIHITTATTTVTSVDLRPSFNEINDNYFYATRAQLTESSKPLPYVATTSVAVTQAFTESPRFAYNPVSGEAEGVLVERGVTNLCVRSQEMNNVAWTKARSSVTANSIRAPDGTYSADKIVEDSSASSTHYIEQIITLSDSTESTLSFYAKAGERTEISIWPADTGWSTTESIIFNLLDGTVTNISAEDAGMEYFKDGWYRCYVVRTTAIGGTRRFRIALSSGGTLTYNGDGSSGAFIWQAQIEASPYPTSPIHTIGSTVSRSADDLDLKSPSIHPNIETGQELSLFAEMRTLSNNTHPTDNRTVISTGTLGARFNLLRIDSAVSYYNYYRAGGPDRGALNSDTSLSHKIAATLSKANLVSVYQDGVLTDSDTKAPSVSGIVQDAYIGRFSSSAGYFDGYIRRISIYDVELTALEVTKL